MVNGFVTITLFLLISVCSISRVLSMAFSDPKSNPAFFENVPAGVLWNRDMMEMFKKYHWNKLIKEMQQMLKEGSVDGNDSSAKQSDDSEEALRNLLKRDRAQEDKKSRPDLRFG